VIGFVKQAFYNTILNPMPRSIRIRQECIPEVKAALLRQGFVRQSDLAEQVQLSQSTISNFLNGRAVDYLNFIEICKFLGLEWQTIADLAPCVDPPTAPSLQPSSVEVPVEIPPQEDFPPGALLALPEGQVELDSTFYIERPPIEQRCYAEIIKPGCLIRIKAPRQMGKTSLMVRILQHASQEGSRTVCLSLQLADQESFETLDRFLQWFCANVSLQLRLPDRLDDYWKSERIGRKVSCKTYFEEYLLREIAQPLTLGIDEVDRLFEYPTLYQEFFGLLRVLHEESKRSEIWRQFRLVVVHSTEVYVPMDVNQSPFNVGLSIELPEFTVEQVQDLVQRHQLAWSLDQTRQLMTIVGGHPFLIRLALYHIACADTTLAELLQIAPTETSIYGDHLRRLGDILSHQPQLETAMQEVVTASSPVRLRANVKFKLLSLGLVKLQGDGATPRCELYRQYFYTLWQGDR
jgi:transcriptional regulator with XRE-family HTH domain